MTLTIDNVTLFWLILFGTAIIESLYDGLNWRFGRYLNFTEKVISSLMRFSIWSFNSYQVMYEGDQRFAWPALGLLLVQSAIFWIVFDPLVNLVAGQKIFYLGKTAQLDRIWRWLTHKWEWAQKLEPVEVQYVAKFLWLAATVTFYFLIQ